MKIDLKILNEIERYKDITRYIMEQEADLSAEVGALAPPEGGVIPPVPSVAVPPAPGGEVPPVPETSQVIDVDNDPDVEKIDDDGEPEGTEKSGTEELDITELVDSQKSIEKKQDEYFDNLFGQLSKLESKLGEMDVIMNKLNALEAKIEKYREKTPQEKLELRSYDSYPFNQKLSQFFDDKKEEMEKTGKHDYILTSDDVTDINSKEIRNTFRPGSPEQNNY